MSCDRNCDTTSSPRKSATMDVAMPPTLVFIRPSLRRGEADRERAVVGRDVDRARARDAEAEALHIAALLDVGELLRVVERGEEPVLGVDRDDVERRGQERPVDHDR